MNLSNLTADKLKDYGLNGSLGAICSLGVANSRQKKGSLVINGI